MESLKITTKVKEEDGPIVIHIQHGDAVEGQLKHSFLTHRDDHLRRVMLDFCDRLDLVYPTVTFWFDGDRIRETQTPGDLGMTDGDVIDAFKQQLGGAFSGH